MLGRQKLQGQDAPKSLCSIGDSPFGMSEKMLVVLSQNKIKITLILAIALEKVDSEPDGMPSHNNL